MLPITLHKYFEEALVLEIPEWFKEVTVDIRDAYGSPCRPRWHQVTGLNFCFNQTRTALFDEQGTGKTLISQAFALWNAAVGNKVICLMPPVLLGQYRDSFNDTFVGADKKVKLEVYRGSISTRRELRNRWEHEGFPDIILMSYEMFLKERNLLPRPDCMVLDECKVLSNPENKTAEAIQDSLGKFGDSLALILNGTPANNMLNDLYGYIKFLTPWVYISRLHFDNIHSEYKSMKIRLKEGKSRSVRTVDKFKNLEVLFKNLYTAARRVEKAQVAELPAKNLITVNVELEEEHYYRYETFFEQRMLEFADDSILDGSTSSSFRQLALQSVIRPDILGLEGESQVVKLAKEIARQTIEAGKKVFILCYYRETVEILKKAFKDYNPAVIFGGTSNSEKQKEKFLKDPECKVLVANYLSGGVGLNLQSVCHTAICVEPITVPGIFDQACDRLHRTGQIENVDIYILRAKGTIFVKAISGMLKKRDINSKVVKPVDLMAEIMGKVEFTEDNSVVEMRSHDTAGLAMSERLG